MRHGLLLGVVLAVLAPQARAADLPPVVLQLAAPGKLLDDIRGMAKAIGGDMAVNQFNEGLKKSLGEKGLSGIDLQRPPVFGFYFRENAPADQSVYAVGIAPYTDENDFLGLLKKSDGKVEPVAGKKGRYVVTASDNKVSYLQFADGFVYLGTMMTEAEFDPSKFPAYDKLVTPGETALVSARLYVDRLPASAQKKMAEALDKAIADMANIPLPPDAKEGVKKATERFGLAARNYLAQLKDVNEAVLRVVYDPASTEAALEIGVVGKPGSPLAADIASRPKSTNRFASIVTKETASALLFGVPLSNTDIREAIALAFESGVKEGTGTAPPSAAAAVDELVKGISRTLRSGELDFGAAVNGPDKDGHFSVLGGVSFDNPAALEAELRKLYKDSPPEVKTLLKLDAAKIGELNVHIARLGPVVPPEFQKVFGEEAELAFCFAPKGIYFVFGVDALTPLKAAVTAAPQEARGLDVVVNPNRLEKLVSTVGGPQAGAMVSSMIGAEDRTSSAFFITVTGGAELKVRIGVNMKVIPRAIFMAMPSSIGPGAAPPK